MKGRDAYMQSGSYSRKLTLTIYCRCTPKIGSLAFVAGTIVLVTLPVEAEGE